MEDILIEKQTAVNEPIKQYIPGSKERHSLQSKLKDMENNYYKIPIIIGGKEIYTGNIGTCKKPHNHNHINLLNYQ